MGGDDEAGRVVGRSVYSKTHVHVQSFRFLSEFADFFAEAARGIS